MEMRSFVHPCAHSVNQFPTEPTAEQRQSDSDETKNDREQTGHGRIRLSQKPAYDEKHNHNKIRQTVENAD